MISKLEWNVVSTLTRLGLLCLFAHSAQAAPDPLGINPNSETYYRYASMAFNADGLPVIAYEDRTQGATITVCEDQNCTTSENYIVDPEGSSNGAGIYSRLLIPNDNRPVIVHVKLASGGGLKLVKCAQTDCTPTMGDSNVITDIGGANFSAVDVDAVLGSDGFPVISVYQQSNSISEGLWIIKCDDEFCGSRSLISIDDSRPESGRSSSIVIGTDGFPVVAYRDKETSGSSGDLVIMKCNSAACDTNDESFSNLAPLGGGLDRNIDMVLNDQGFPVIAFFGPQSVLSLITCNDSACLGGDETLNTITTPAGLGFALSLQLATDGTPLIAAHAFSSSNGNLLIIDCNDAFCADGDEAIFTLFDSANPDIVFGRYLDMVMSLNNFPTIVYSREDQTGATDVDSLRLVQCLSDDCVSLFMDGFE